MVDKIGPVQINDLSVNLLSIHIKFYDQRLISATVTDYPTGADLCIKKIYSALVTHQKIPSQLPHALLYFCYISQGKDTIID
ncbi:MAG TPA: hypothetical protein DEB63_18240 [Agrobacterium sp.]|nr:hypothetical protein [Agrobacterium sp.]